MQKSIFALLLICMPLVKAHEPQGTTEPRPDQASHENSGVIQAARILSNKDSKKRCCTIS